MIKRILTEKELKILKKANNDNLSVMPNLIKGQRKYMVTNRVMLLFVDEVPVGYEKVDPIIIGGKETVESYIIDDYNDYLEKFQLAEYYDTLIYNRDLKLTMMVFTTEHEAVSINVIYKKYFDNKNYVLSYNKESKVIRIEDVSFGKRDLVGFVMPGCIEIDCLKFKKATKESTGKEAKSDVIQHDEELELNIKI